MVTLKASFLVENSKVRFQKTEPKPQNEPETVKNLYKPNVEN